MSAVKTMTIAQVAERWIAHLEGEATPFLFDTDQHVDTTLAVVDELIVPMLGGRPADTINEEIAETWAHRVLDQFEPGTILIHVGHALDILQALLDWATDEGFIPSSPCVEFASDVRDELAVIA